MNPRSLVIVALGLIVSAPHAQAPSNWTSITLPSNLVSGPQQIGTTVSLQTTDSVWLYSGITKHWTVLPVTNTPIVFQANDYLIVQDGNRLHGYSSHRGAVDSITTSTPFPTIISGSASSSWVTLVADGTQAYAFGAFHGRWESVTLSQPNPTMVASRLTGLLHDGSTVYGVSAHHGTFVPVAADTNAALVLVNESEVGTASSPGVFRGFSAQQNTWGVRNVPTSAVPFQQAEYAMMIDGSQAWAYSGITGTFDHYVGTMSIPAPPNGSAGVAAFQDGPLAVCYASGVGRFATLPAPNATFVIAYHFAFVDEGGSRVTPFTALTGSFGQPIIGSFGLSANDAIGFAASPAISLAYSPILNRWFPATVANPIAVELVRDAVVLVHSTGYDALSARSGRWVRQATTTISNYVTSTRGSTFVAIDGNQNIARVFDARLDRWASVVAQAPLTVNISRHTALAHDGLTGFGFGQPSGEWYSLPLTAPPSAARASSSIATIVHGNELGVYAVHGTLSYTGRYPEFTQAINLGNTLRLHQVAPPGSVMTTLIGFAPARIDFGPTLGYLYVDPAQSFAIPFGAAVGSSGIAELALRIPQDPNLRHLQIHFQNLVLPPASASPWLSSSVAPIIF